MLIGLFIRATWAEGLPAGGKWHAAALFVREEGNKGLCLWLRSQGQDKAAKTEKQRYSEAIGSVLRIGPL